MEGTHWSKNSYPHHPSAYYNNSLPIINYIFCADNNLANIPIALVNTCGHMNGWLDNIFGFLLIIVGYKYIMIISYYGFIHIVYIQITTN